MKIPPHKIILSVVAIFTLVMGILLYFSPPAIFPDPGSGFQVLRSMEMGSGFNLLIKPSQADITKNTTEFLTWWTPGQYLAPWFFKWLLGVNAGQAIAIVITLCQLLGLSGLYCFFKKIGFSPLIAAVSIAFIACQQFYAQPYIFYTGGEVLLFGFSGWFLYGCTALRKPGWALCLFVLLAGWIGFFCKSSFAWIYLAGCFYLWLRLSLPKRTVAEHIRNGIWIAVPALISLVAIYLFFLSKGQTPASASGQLKLAWPTFGFPLASPLLAGFSVDDLFNGLLFPSGIPVINPSTAVGVIVLMAILSLLLIFAIIRFIPNNNYKLLILVFYTISVLFFSYAYAQQMAISYEARHYRVIGIIIIPGVVYLLGNLKIPYRIVFGLVWLGIAVFSFRYLAKGYNFNKTVSARGTTGIAQPFIDQPSLDQVLTLDAQQHDALFVFTNIAPGLEIKHNRIITLEQISDYDQIDLEDYEYDGHAGPLYIVLPASYSEKVADTILRFFPDYHDFAEIKLSEKYVLYTAR